MGIVRTDSAVDNNFRSCFTLCQVHARHVLHQVQEIARRHCEEARRADEAIPSQERGLLAQEKIFSAAGGSASGGNAFYFAFSILFSICSQPLSWLAKLHAYMI